MKYADLVKKMTLDEKASLMSGKNFWETQNIDRLGIPSVFLADGPHGIRKQDTKAADHLGMNASIETTCYPTSATIANSWNESIVEEVGKHIGKEAKSLKVSMVLGPGTNIKRNPLAGRNFEYYSEDPYLSGKMVSAAIKGIQSNGVYACVKHFAANNQEHRRLSVDSVLDERTLREIYLTPFEMAVKEGKTHGLMTAYNPINGTYANENEHLLKEILRNEWGYKGIIVSDWGGNNDRVKALNASVELEMPGTGGLSNKEIIEAVKKGEIELSTLDESVDRMLTFIFETHKKMDSNNEMFDIEKHHNVAKKAAEESIVLLKNQEKILPISKDKKVAIIGDFAHEPRYQGAGSSGVNPTKLDSILDLVKAEHFDCIGYEKGFNRYGKNSNQLINKAKKLAVKADIVIMFLGLDEYSETEGLDRNQMTLPKNQINLIREVSKINPNIIVILACGSPIELDWDVNSKALVHGYLPGQAGAGAILDILTGTINPSGKLAETYARKKEDLPNNNYFPGKMLTAEYKEALFIGYRYFDSAKVNVKYPFGYGLSYTRFEYSNLQISEQGVNFKVKNIGDIKGKEIAQLYIGKKDSKMIRPLKELKGFMKESIEPGQSKTFEIHFDDKSFRYFNTLTNNWEIEEGSYEIYVGSSSTDILLQGSIDIKGTNAPLPYNIEEFSSYKNADVKFITKEEFEKLLGRKVPKDKYTFIKKNRIKINKLTTVEELRYARGWTGRFFAWAIRTAHGFLNLIGKKKMAGILILGIYSYPLRNISSMSGGAINSEQLDGIVTMFDGKFFKGLKQFFKAGKKRKLERKEVKNGRKNK